MGIAVKTGKIDVVILCGGLGKRLRPAVHGRPKPMAEIDRHPFLEILIDYVRNFGFQRFILCTGYMGRVIKRHFKRKKNVDEILFSEERKELGTAGAIKNAETLIKSSTFLAMNGDSFCEMDLRKFVRFHKRKRALISVALTDDLTEAHDCGTVVLDGFKRVVSFNEKRSSKNKNFLVSTGIYAMDKKMLRKIPPDGYFSLEIDLFPEIVDRGFYGYKTQGAFIDIGTPARYKLAKELFRAI